MVVWLVLLLCGAAAPRVQGQEANTLDPAKALRQYVHQAWQVDEGLPQSTVEAITRTRDGYLWLGTEDGLVRFHGVRFAVFDERNTEVFETGHAIEILLADPDGGIWIGTVRAGLVRHADGQFTRYAVPDGLTGREITALYRDAAGTLWVATRTGLNRVVDGAVQSYDAAGLPRVPIRALWEGEAGVLWIDMEGNGLGRLYADRFETSTTADGLASNTILSLYEDAEGTLWVGTYEGGLSRIKNGILTTFTTFHGLFNDTVYAILEDASGRQWTLWFYALCMVGVIGFVFGVYRWRVRHLKARERVLQAQAAAHTEDLQVAKEQIEAQPERLLELDRFKTRFFAKFTQEGQIVPQVRRIGGNAILRVQDSGIGIAEDFMPTLFEAFTQGNTGLKRTHSGIGLGLTVTQRLVTLLGGVIDVESTKGQGSISTVRFPATEPSVPASSLRSRVSEAT